MDFERFRLWVYFWAYVIFVGADIITTILGMHIEGVVEGNPLYVEIFESQSEISIIVLKHAIFASFYVLEKNIFGSIFGRELSTVIPLTLAIYGTYIMINNIYVLLSQGLDPFSIIAPIVVFGLLSFELMDWKTKADMQPLD